MDEAPEWEGDPIGPFLKLRADRIFLMDFGDAPTDDEIDAHSEAFIAWCDANREPVGGIVYLRRLLTGTAQQRKRMAELETRLENHDAQFVTAVGIVAPNALTRGLVTAVFWLKPPVYPYKLFANFDDARGWVEEAMRSAAA